VTDAGKSTRDALLARAAALAPTDPNQATLLAAAIEATDPDDLALIDEAGFARRLATSHAHLGAGVPAKSAIHIVPAANATDPLVVDIVSPDMPFIVDSALAAIRAAGGVVRLFSHPLMFITPDGKLARKPQAGFEPVSLLHVELDPVPDPEALRAELERTFTDVAGAVADWRPMLEETRTLATMLRETRPEVPGPMLEEAIYFLEWLGENNFTFLGLRRYRLVAGELTPEPESGLGILRDPSVKFLRSGPDFVEVTPQHAAFMASFEPLLITKSNVRGRVHRRVHMDYIGIKLYDGAGDPVGEVRILGLFTAQALATPHVEVPVVRRKIVEVMRRSGLETQSHARRALMSALDGYPRDELFQISADELAEYGHVIAGLYDRPRVRVLPRIDRFDNFVSILVYVPRDRYDSDIRARITDYLAQRYDGRVSAYYPNFPEGDLVRVHVIIGRIGGPTPRPARAELEAAIEDMTRSFGDRLMATAEAPGSVAAYREAFSAAYESRNGVAEALSDIATFETLSGARDVAIRLRAQGAEPGQLGVKFYHLGGAIPLSDRVPMLEHFGFRVIDERTYTVRPKDGATRYLHDMVVAAPADLASDPGAAITTLEIALLAVWNGEAESDGFNALTLRAGLDWDAVAVLRALSRYLRQIGTSYSQRYLAQVLVDQSVAAGALFDLFAALHGPAGGGSDAAKAARDAITAARDAATSLDEDRILARFETLIDASVRTNFFQRGPHEAHRAALAIKFDCSKVEGLPAPVPYREIFVYSPRVEGIHLRFGAIARGGLRWSDRPEDFRTEVLGLVKAQQVKNAVIVPVGAKGGFVPKRLSTGMARDAFLAEGTESYKIFVGALLDLTDNLVDGAVVPPEGVVRRDGDDPYLVVAADKGTASFSDTANAIATERGYWLGDAFASGGSAGYDHKEMGITARGGWEAVKRHFREMDRDIQTEPFTVAGIGDMSGDVFGNGMLLSKEIRLVAAFDHRDIFIDPTPDAEASFAERQRLFALPRSSWQDYDNGLISTGGGVFSRALKAIPLSPEMRQLTGLAGETATPNEVMRAILKADVDLMWFGGIGTYVRAPHETNGEVGDRANDAIRITADELRAKVVGEGANLGITQKARIAFNLGGGRINTDAIDNSAGVNSSDLEVNIKIALGPLMADGTLPLAERNTLLEAMTEEVAALCLRNNYLQPLAISLARRAGLAELPDHLDLMRTLEERGLLDRAVEFLPSDAEIDARATSGDALTRPELAVLLAYAKLTLYADLLESEAPDDPYLAGELFRYFPPTLKDRHGEAVRNHRLRREVIATVLANAMINRGGPALVTELMRASSAGVGEVALAYAATRDVYGLTELNTRIDGLDGQVAGAVQLELYAGVGGLLRREMLWFLRNADITGDIGGLVERHSAGVARLGAEMSRLVPASIVADMSAGTSRFVAAGVPEDLAHAIAALPVLAYASDVVLASERSGTDLGLTAEAFFGVFGLFGLWPIVDQGREIVLADPFDRMALDRALANLTRAQRDLTADILAAGDGPIAERIAKWRATRPTAVDRAIESVGDLTKGLLTVSRLSVAAGLLADLARET
jgi:glutamate dehydrogenase